MSHISFTLFTLHLQGALLFPNHLQGLFQCPSSQKVSIPWKSSGFRFKIFNLGLLLMIRLRRYITNIASLDRMVGDHRPRLLITYYIFLSLDLTTFSPMPLPSLLSVRWLNVELRWESGGAIFHQVHVHKELHSTIIDYTFWKAFWHLISIIIT